MNRVLALLAILLLAARPAAAAEPDRAVVAAHVAAALPPILALRADWRSRTFADPGGHSGRISIEGTLVTAQPLYGVNPAGPTFGLSPQLVQRGLHRLVADAADRGVPPSQVLRLAEQSQRINWITRVLEETVPAGTAVPFRAEIRYLETVSGFDLSGRPQYTAPKGERPGDLQNALVRDSLDYLRSIDVIVGFWEQEQRVLDANAAAMAAFLAREGLAALFPLQRDAAPAPILLIPPTVPAWNEDSYRAYTGAPVRRLSFHTRVTARIGAPVTIGGTTYAPGQTIEIDLKGSVIGDAEPLKNATLTIELAGATPPGLSGEMRWTGTGFAVTPTAPDSGWRLAPGATPPPAAPATPPASGLAALNGRWTSQDGRLAVQIANGVGILTAGGAGRRPDGIDLLYIDDFDGQAGTGRMRFTDGQFKAVTLGLVDGRLEFRGGGTRWSWTRG